MSRCFPYPPPGHTLSMASSGALIESIKLQKLKEETKEQRKKEKREKKERRKEKKEKKERKKEKRKEKTNQNLDKSDSAKVDISKGIEVGSECEQLERSSLTEENGQPVCLRTSSSDSTENSNKRKRHSSSLDDTRPHSKIILVRLPSKKLDGCSPSLKEQQVNSTSGRVERTQNKPGSQPLPLERTSNISQSPTLKTDRVGICSTSGRTEDLPPVKIRKSVPNRIQRLESQYKDLIVDWVPPMIEDACLYSEDLGWLCKSKNQDTRDVKRSRLENEGSVLSCSVSSGLWPRAQYLSDDIYALPYTVPF